MKPVDLDTASIKELYEKACGIMSKCVPGWSDEYPSDPAVAVLELAARLSKFQNESINEVRESHFEAYLKLLGYEPQKLTSASFLVSPIKMQGLYKGKRFWIDGVPFEAENVVKNRGKIKNVKLHFGSNAIFLKNDRPLRIKGDGTRIEIEFTKHLPAGEAIKLWCGILPDARRNPPDDDTHPPVYLEGIMPDEAGGSWFRIDDGTCGLLQSGYITFTLCNSIDTIYINIKGEPEEGTFITDLVLEPVLLVQRRTRSLTLDLEPPFILPEMLLSGWKFRYFLPYGEKSWKEVPTLSVKSNVVAGWKSETPHLVRVVASESDFMHEFQLKGTAEERIYIDGKGILPDSLRVMTEENGIWYDCPVMKPDSGKTIERGCEWDHSNHRLCFGDGRNFEIPKEGKILISGCACCIGSAGNGAAVDIEQENISFQHLYAASGGLDGETYKEAFLRAAKETEMPLKAVCVSDYETIAGQAPGLAIEKVRAYAGKSIGESGAGVTVFAKPFSEDGLPVLTPWQEKRLSDWLEGFRMIGVPVTVRSPRYIAVEVCASIRSNEPVDENLMINAAVKLTDGVKGPLDFGAEISYSALFSALASIPGVRKLKTLELYVPDGGGKRTWEGGIKLEPGMLPYLKKFSLKNLDDIGNR